MFPFKHNGKTYKTCAKSSDGKGPYCATKVDSDGKLVNDKWARCNDYCKNEEGEIKVFLIVVMICIMHFHTFVYVGIYHKCLARGQDKNFKRGKGSDQECKFPFRLNGLEYDGCAKSFENGKGPRCATEVDGNKILKKWARCNDVCTIDSGM